MVRKTLKTNILAVSSLVLASSLVLCSPLNSALATSSGDVTFQVDINEVLTVSLTTPDTWASGDLSFSSGSDLLRNKVGLSVTSNNGAGFSAFMASKENTNLVNTAKSTATIPTLASNSTAGEFPVNRWGYSLDDVDAGSSSASYSAMQTSLISIATSSEPTTLNQNIFFGAKADATIDSGTYANTVIFSVVSGYVDPTDPVVPDDPVNPITPDTPTYDEDNDRTIYTEVATGTQTAPVETSTTTTTTTITEGDTTDSYTAPQGVNNVSSSSFATGLAVASVATAATGMFFFILAKRKKDDDDEEESEDI